MARWGILAVAVTAALLLSIAAIAAGYLFSGMMAARMAGLEYYRAGGEAVAARTEAVTAAATAAPAAGKEGQGAAGAQEAVTAYAGRGRMISYTASMSLLVPRGGVKRCVDAILSLVSSYGGYISSLSVWEDRAVLAVKVPQGSMMAFMEDVSRMGRVAGRSISGTDLADRIIDLEARLRGAREAEARLLELLDRARSVDEVLSIMREASRVRGEIEAMEAQLRNLETSISYAAITIEVSEEPGSRRVEVIFRVLDSRGQPVPGAQIYLKAGEARRLVTDEFGEAEAALERGSNISLIAVFRRPDGELLRASMSDVADSNKTVIIRFDKPSEPPAVNLEALPGLASTLASYLVTGLMILAIIIIPLMILMLAVITAAKRMYHRLAPARRQDERKQ